MWANRRFSDRSQREKTAAAPALALEVRLPARTYLYDHDASRLKIRP